MLHDWLTTAGQSSYTASIEFQGSFMFVQRHHYHLHSLMPSLVLAC